MKIKLQLGIIVMLFVFLGTYLEQTIVPNQQIVIQFSDTNISSEATENTIEAVKEQLQNIGVSHINIGQHEDGKLRITYYSEADVSRIQSILSKEDGFKFAYQTSENNSSDFPDNENDYELNISEIQDGSDTNWGFEGIQIVELNQKSDRFSNPNDDLSGGNIDVENYNAAVQVAIQVNGTVDLATDNTSYIIPEVRAGPSNREFII
jgi:preprotein translocase subunit SecD